MERVRLICKESSAEVCTFGAMTTAEFVLDGKRISPFYQNPWNTAFA